MEELPGYGRDSFQYSLFNKSREIKLENRSTEKSLPLFFAYGRSSYRRYPAVHYYKILALETKFPKILEELENWEFSVWMSTCNPFGKMETDVTQTTINRNTETPGGKTGIFHSFKNQSTLGCINYLRKKFLRNYLCKCIYIFLDFKIGNGLCYFFLTTQLKQSMQQSCSFPYSICC